MNILNRLRGVKTHDLRLHGIWNSDLNDLDTRENIGSVQLTFTPEGELTYNIQELDKIQIIKLVYWTDKEILYTDQPSHPRQEKTRYIFPDQASLLLEFNGEKTRYVRVKN